MTSWTPSWNCDVKSKIRLRQSMHIYAKQLEPNFIAIRLKTTELFWRSFQQQQQQQDIGGYEISSWSLRKWELALLLDSDLMFRLVKRISSKRTFHDISCICSSNFLFLVATSWHTSFYRAMLHRARLCHRMLSVRLSVWPWRSSTVITKVGILRK